MRIVHLSTSDITGGAARAAYRLHSGLRQHGLDSQMLVANRKSSDPSVHVIGSASNLAARLQRQLRLRRIAGDFAPYARHRAPGMEPFSDDRSRYAAELVGRLPTADVVTLHWVAGLLDYQAFFGGLPARVPVVWRLSDMNAFTGGCHYDQACGRWATGCGRCPQLGSSSPADLSQQIWRRKKTALGRLDPDRLHIVALNSWMADAVRRSPLLGRFPVHTIPNGLDTETFAPRDRAFARDVLGIPQDARVVLFVAMAASNRRKGFDLLLQALARLDDVPNLFLVSIGRKVSGVDPRLPHLNVGELSQDRLLSLVYSAADLFAIPSLQDNQPSTVLEALACGVPVVGFDTGGIAEMVRPGVTGALAPVGDVAGLRAALAALLADRARLAEMGAAARKVARGEYHQELQVRRYSELYAELVERRGLLTIG